MLQRSKNHYIYIFVWGGGGGGGRGLMYRTFALKCTTFRNDLENKQSVQIKHIS